MPISPASMRKSKSSKGQAALEFLTTYGWALLVLLVMLGALAYFGVFNVKDFLPEKCIFNAGIGCRDFAGVMSDSTVKAQLINSFGYPIIITGVKVEASGVAGTITDCCNVQSGNPDTEVLSCVVDNDWCGVVLNGPEWKSGSEKGLDVQFSALASYDRPRVDVEINYTKAGSVYNKRITGTIQVKTS